MADGRRAGKRRAKNGFSSWRFMAARENLGQNGAGWPAAAIRGKKHCRTAHRRTRPKASPDGPPPPVCGEKHCRVTRHHCMRLEIITGWPATAVRSEKHRPMVHRRCMQPKASPDGPPPLNAATSIVRRGVKTRQNGLQGRFALGRPIQWVLSAQNSGCVSPGWGWHFQLYASPNRWKCAALNEFGKRQPGRGRNKPRPA